MSEAITERAHLAASHPGERHAQDALLAQLTDDRREIGDHVVIGRDRELDAFGGDRDIRFGSEMSASTLGAWCRCKSAEMHPGVGTTRLSSAASTLVEPGQSSKRKRWESRSMPLVTSALYFPGGNSRSIYPVAGPHEVIRPRRARRPRGTAVLGAFRRCSRSFAANGRPCSSRTCMQDSPRLHRRAPRLTGDR